MKLWLSHNQLQAIHQEDSYKVRKAEVEELKRQLPAVEEKRSSLATRISTVAEVRKEDMKTIASLTASLEAGEQEDDEQESGDDEEDGEKQHLLLLLNILWLVFCNIQGLFM